jgi:hypothetical protein
MANKRPSYRPPPWRAAASAEAYVHDLLIADAATIEDGRVKAISELRVAVSLLDDAVGKPGAMAIVLKAAVEMARTVHERVHRAKQENETKRVKPQAALKALAIVREWVWKELDPDANREAVFRQLEDQIGGAIWESENVLTIAGATRQMGGTDLWERDKAAHNFAIGAIAYWVKDLLILDRETTIVRPSVLQHLAAGGSLSEYVSAHGSFGEWKGFGGYKEHLCNIAQVSPGDLTHYLETRERIEEKRGTS